MSNVTQLVKPSKPNHELVAEELEQIAAHLRAGKLDMSVDRAVLVMAGRGIDGDAIAHQFLGADTTLAYGVGLLEAAKFNMLTESVD